MGAKWFGASVQRKEDPALLTGRGRFVDDIKLPGMLHVMVLRSPHPHAAIRGIDKTRALALPGVHAVVTYADLPAGETIFLDASVFIHHFEPNAAFGPAATATQSPDASTAASPSSTQATAPIALR